MTYSFALKVQEKIALTWPDQNLDLGCVSQFNYKVDMHGLVEENEVSVTLGSAS